jgi:hypothetical protein
MCEADVRKQSHPFPIGAPVGNLSSHRLEHACVGLSTRKVESASDTAHLGSSGSLRGIQTGISGPRRARR